MKEKKERLARRWLREEFDEVLSPREKDEDALAQEIGELRPLSRGGLEEEAIAAREARAT